MSVTLRLIDDRAFRRTLRWLRNHEAAWRLEAERWRERELEALTGVWDGLGR